MKKMLPSQVFRKLAVLYDDMQKQYVQYAGAVGLSCTGCSQNCCTSFFQHHTHVEWAYLLRGLSECDETTRSRYVARAHQYVRSATEALQNNRKPDAMCPLNDDGLCGLYQHRLMICRLHGVPNLLRFPNGRKIEFPGCFRSQELCRDMNQIPVLDRTPLYTRLMELEMQYVGAKIRTRPRVDLTLAEMIVHGEPEL